MWAESELLILKQMVHIVTTFLVFQELYPMYVGSTRDHMCDATEGFTCKLTIAIRWLNFLPTLCPQPDSLCLQLGSDWSIIIEESYFFRLSLSCLPVFLICNWLYIRQCRHFTVQDDHKTYDHNARILIW